MQFEYESATLSQGSVTISYIDRQPSSAARGVILLIHGFPQTSYQYRHVIEPLVSHGYRAIVPDYRGAGRSSKPSSDNGSSFTKTKLAADLVGLLDHLGIAQPIHVVGHDVGGMVAWAFASRHPSRTKSLIWGECPLPGSSVFENEYVAHQVQQFHFVFHRVPDLPEQLVRGEAQVWTYLDHFLTKITSNKDAIKPEDVDVYVRAYAQEDAMRCAFELYRAFRLDAEENKAWLEEHGKVKVPTLALNGSESRHAPHACVQFPEVHEEGTYEVATVAGSAHYVAEENPAEFVRQVLEFVARQK